MKNQNKRFVFGILIILVVFFNTSFLYAQSDIPSGNNQVKAQSTSLSLPQVKSVEKFITQRMLSRKNPGLALVIVKENQVVYQKGFGYADLKTKAPVTPETFFELGSNSKAFTALGILRLRDQGLLQLSDPVSKYLPWFYMKLGGKKVSMTIEQLLHQTGGIPFNSIRDIPVSEADSALADTVKTLVGKELDHRPGESFLYATMNYDVLGLIIQQVSGESFEKYMETNVLLPLGLKNTFLFRQEAMAHGLMATGYKIGFMRPLQYDAPHYRGNTPAGYFISNARDLGEWMKIQMGTSDPTAFNRALIAETQFPDYTVLPGADGSFYAMGWTSTRVNGGNISHGGANPNFSSYIILKPEQKIGVAVLTNLGNIESEDAQSITQGVMDICSGLKPEESSVFNNQSLDSMATIVVFVAVGLILSSFGLIFFALAQLIRKGRHFQGKGFKGLVGIIASLGLLALFGYCLYMIPDVLLQGFNWDFLLVWGPLSIIYAAILACCAVLIFYLHFLLISYFPKPDERPFFSLAVLSIVSGLGNAFIIFTINAALNADRNHFATTLFIYFVMAIIIYVFGTRIVRKQMTIITNDIVYFKRITLINRILKASYQKLEMLEDGKIHAGLNNDTEVVSNFANLLIGGVTSLITLICCFIYLGILNIYGLLVSVLVIIIAAGLYFYVGKSANKLWEQTRDIQNQFFRFINDLVGGFKELYMHEKKRDDFADDMKQTCKTYRDKRMAGEFKFINVFVIGELLFTFVIAAVAFVFPTLFKNMHVNDLRTYVFIFLYMTNPVHGVLNTIPGVIQFRISWKRINQLLDEIATIQLETAYETKEESVPGAQDTLIRLQGVVFKYQSENGEEFEVGPINALFNTGEITFITGGNGSGKSTLAKLLTGLYVPLQGEIKINGASVSTQDLSQRYSAVFSDFYLFEKLYGIDYKNKQEAMQHYLKTLKIDDKVQIQNGLFSTIKLSTGQKKRLALLICYLEDRPVYLFDEWAADQDAEFRKFFYQILLPELRERGKCVIVISHDDRYFDMADQLIKMEMGQIVEKRKNSTKNNLETA